jgi:hypothetical protein
MLKTRQFVEDYLSDPPLIGHQARSNDAILTKTGHYFAKICQKVLAKCSKAVYNIHADLCKAHLYKYEGGLENV